MNLVFVFFRAFRDFRGQIFVSRFSPKQAPTHLAARHAGVERCLREHSPDCETTVRIGAIAFIHRFGSSLNAHTHFHCCVVDGVFQPMAKISNSDTAEPITSVDFHAAINLNTAAIAQGWRGKTG
jgi:hypothetical protein